MNKTKSTLVHDPRKEFAVAHGFHILPTETTNMNTAAKIIKEYNKGFRVIDICKKHKVTTHEVINLVYSHKIKG